jgi:hypothetical protein
MGILKNIRTAIVGPDSPPREERGRSSQPHQRDSRSCSSCSSESPTFTPFRKPFSERGRSHTRRGAISVPSRGRYPRHASPRSSAILDLYSNGTTSLDRVMSYRHSTDGQTGQRRKSSHPKEMSRSRGGNRQSESNFWGIPGGGRPADGENNYGSLPNMRLDVSRSGGGVLFRQPNNENDSLQLGGDDGHPPAIPRVDRPSKTPGRIFGIDPRGYPHDRMQSGALVEYDDESRFSKKSIARDRELWDAKLRFEEDKMRSNQQYAVHERGRGRGHEGERGRGGRVRGMRRK